MTTKTFECGRCNRTTDESPEFCWYCTGPLCSFCWEEFGHCGHEGADLLNQKARRPNEIRDLAETVAEELAEREPQVRASRGLPLPYVPPQGDIPTIHIQMVSYNEAEFNLRVWLTALTQHAGIDGLTRILMMSFDKESKAYLFSFDGIREQIERRDKVFVLEPWPGGEYVAGRHYLQKVTA